MMFVVTKTNILGEVWYLQGAWTAKDKLTEVDTTIWSILPEDALLFGSQAAARIRMDSHNISGAIDELQVTRHW